MIRFNSFDSWIFLQLHSVRFTQHNGTISEDQSSAHMWSQWARYLFQATAGWEYLDVCIMSSRQSQSVSTCDGPRTDSRHSVCCIWFGRHNWTADVGGKTKQKHLLTKRDWDMSKFSKNLKCFLSTSYLEYFWWRQPCCCPVTVETTFFSTPTAGN